MILLDGPFEGMECQAVPHGCWSIVIPELDGDGRSFAKHTYGRDGRWISSETFVGYQSDETIRRDAELDDWMYWTDLEAHADESFV